MAIDQRGFLLLLLFYSYSYSLGWKVFHMSLNHYAVLAVESRIDLPSFL